MTTQSATTVRVTLVGGPTTLIEYAGLRIVTDPTFDAPTTYGPETTGHPDVTLVKTLAPAVQPDQLQDADLVLITHDHLDHLDIAGREFAASASRVLTTDVAADIVPGAEVLTDWETRTLASPDGRTVTITAVPAHHGPDGVWQAIGPVIGFIIECPGERTIYVSGDNSDVDVVREIAAKFPSIDIAVLFVGGPTFEVFGPSYIVLCDETAADATEVLGSATIIPVHADSWAHFSQTTSSMKKVADARGVGDRVIALAPGDFVDV